VNRTNLSVVATPERRAGPATGPRGGIAVVAQQTDLERVFRAEYPRVVTLANRVVGDQHAAEDIAQEVFLGFARAELDEAAARGWLAVAAVHTALNTVRAARRRSDRELRAETDPTFGQAAVPGDPAEETVRSLDRARVRRALAVLPRNQAVALVLRHSGVSYADIADALGIAASGVGTTVRRAEAALRKELISVDASS
jgi:RNA polymerase sigma-70 factor (ECF subfamily)